MDRNSWLVYEALVSGCNTVRQVAKATGLRTTTIQHIIYKLIKLKSVVCAGRNMAGIRFYALVEGFVPPDQPSENKYSLELERYFPVPWPLPTGKARLVRGA